MITFSIEDATIESLLYLLILISSVILIALVYLIALMKENNKRILEITSKYICDSLANGSSTYKKGFGGMVSPIDLKVTGEQLKGFIDDYKNKIRIES